MRLRICLLMLVLLSPSLSGYRLIYREQLYELYHVHFYQQPERIAENIYWLEQALRADFANPLYALARIDTTREWEWYRNLFTMHINLKLVELYLRWGSKHNKFTAFFYNHPWKRQNLESLDKAEALMRYARVYWKEARAWSDKEQDTRFIHLEEIQAWEDEHHRIQEGDLDYGKIITDHLKRLAKVRADFERMPPY